MQATNSEKGKKARYDYTLPMNTRTMLTDGVYLRPFDGNFRKMKIDMTKIIVDNLPEDAKRAYERAGAIVSMGTVNDVSILNTISNEIIDEMISKGDSTYALKEKFESESTDVGKKLKGCLDENGTIQTQLTDLRSTLMKCENEKNVLADKLMKCEDEKKALIGELEAGKKASVKELRECEDKKKALIGELEAGKEASVKELRECEDKKNALIGELEAIKKACADKLKDCEEEKKALIGELEAGKEASAKELKDYQEDKKSSDEKLEAIKKESSDKLNDCEEEKKKCAEDLKIEKIRIEGLIKTVKSVHRIVMKHNGDGTKPISEDLDMILETLEEMVTRISSNGESLAELLDLAQQATSECITRHKKYEVKNLRDMVGETNPLGTLVTSLTIIRNQKTVPTAVYRNHIIESIFNAGSNIDKIGADEIASLEKIIKDGDIENIKTKPHAERVKDLMHGTIFQMTAMDTIKLRMK